MKKRYTKGARLLMIMTGLMLFFSYFEWRHAISDTRDEKVLYQEGNRFDGDSGASIVNVLGIEELDLKDRILDKGENFYMIETEQAFLILKSSRQDLKKVIGDRLGKDGKLRKFAAADVYARINTVPEESRRKKRTIINIRPELKEKFRQTTEKSVLIMVRLKDLSDKYDGDLLTEKVKDRPFYYNVYVEPTGMEYHFSNFSKSAGFSLVTLGMLYVAVRRIRWAKESYKRLFAAYPEIEVDMEKLLLDADYLDKKLKVLVYKNSIIVYSNIFEFEEINKIDEIVLNEVVRKGQVMGYTINIRRDSRKSSFNLWIGKRKDRDLIRDLGSYLRKHHSLQVTYKF